jgi:large subunit ribosomal protein L30
MKLLGRLRRNKEGRKDGKTIRIRQVRSGIGCPVEMRETLKALGLGRMHRITERVDSPEVRGMIAKIPHLVEVVE